MSRDKIEKWDEVNGITAPERSLEAFLESSTDTYAILQLRDSELFWKAVRTPMRFCS